MASAGVGSASHQEVLLVAEAMGLNLKPIPGYAGREGEMAMLRGEVAGQLGSYVALRPYIKSEGCRILLQVGAKKHKELQDVPLALEQKVSERGKKLLSLVAGAAEVWRLTAAPPNMPSGRLDVLRESYKKAVTDPELLKEAEKVGMEFDPGFGEDVARIIREVMNQPEENIVMLKKIIKFEE
jgi:tripartite-type tricarboxylate transporter receptor subunit TctC